jgi:hypothetical protein
MFKVALLAATVFACLPTAQAATADLDLSAPPATESPCRIVSSLDMGCALRIVDAGNTGSMPPVDATNLAAAPTVTDWAEPHPISAGIDFKDAANVPATLEPDRPQALIPALAALAAMVILLRRRPTSF